MDVDGVGVTPEDALLPAAREDPGDQVDHRCAGLGQRLGLGQVLGPVDVLDGHQPDEVGVFGVVVEGQLGQVPDGLGGVQTGDVHGLFGLADAGVGALQDLDVELFLAAEVVVDHPLGGAGEGGYLVDAGPGVAALGEFAGGDVQDLGLGADGVAEAAVLRRLIAHAGPTLRPGLRPGGSQEGGPGPLLSTLLTNQFVH
ncbi:hypothetical protein GCM10009579_43340 [Streptomyces javensis]|uniref:Uncharacterized protein n=1 Tax=Streptomyces javensis TaxID=114698 RepID=A0ABN1X1T0_9ACTN